MMSLGVNDARLFAKLALLGKSATNGTKPLRAFYLAIKPQWLKQWNAVKATGGTFRGKAWPAFADQYTRKTDGVTVPAWGGVRRIERGFQKSKVWASDIATRKEQRRGVSTGERMKRRSGNVSGKLRGSDKRVTQNSIQMRDTGELSQRLLPPRADITRERIVLGGDAPDYYEHLHNKRPVLFWTQADQQELNRAAKGYLDELARDFNG